jgi:histidine triad (HIT) family protein
LNDLPSIDCTFCRIIEGKEEALILHEDARIISFLPLRPQVTGHTLVVPKAHYADIFAIPDDLLSAVIASCKTHALRWREQVGATGINLLHASGADGEQSVFHFHFHAFPRFAGDGLETWPELPGSRHSREAMHSMFRLDR